jgi:hypothetical protein
LRLITARLQLWFCRKGRQDGGRVLSFIDYPVSKTGNSMHDISLSPVLCSYRDIGEALEERGLNADHTTLDNRVIKYSALLASVAKKYKPNVATSIETAYMIRKS